MFRLANDKRLTVENLGGFIDKHREIVQNRYKPLMDAYRTKYPIFFKNQSLIGNRIRESLLTLQNISRIQ